MEKKKNKTSAAQIRASNKYTREKCDRLSCTIPKGHRPAWEAAAAAEGVSLSRWVLHTLDAAAAAAQLDHDGQQDSTGATPDA